MKSGIKRLIIIFRNLPLSAKGIIAFVLFVIILLFYFGAKESISKFFFNREIQKLEKVADAKVKDANTHEEKADVWSDERKEKEAEYKGRQPLREKADRDVENAKRELERLKREYEKAINNKPDNSDVDLAERELRAIREARELYQDKP